MLFTMIQRSGVSLTVTLIVTKTYTLENYYLVFDQNELLYYKSARLICLETLKAEHPYLKFRTTLTNEQGEKHKQTVNKSTM